MPIPGLAHGEDVILQLSIAIYRFLLYLLPLALVLKQVIGYLCFAIVYAVVRGTALKNPPHPAEALDLASGLVASPSPQHPGCTAQVPALCMLRQRCLPPLVCPVCVCGQIALVLSTAISMCLPLPNFSLGLPPLLTEELESRQVGWRASGQWSGVAGWVEGVGI